MSFYEKLNQQETVSEGLPHSFAASRSYHLPVTQVIFNPYCKLEETYASKTYKHQRMPPSRHRQYQNT